MSTTPAARIIRASGEVEDLASTDRIVLRAAVGGFLETVPVKVDDLAPALLWIDEHALFLRRPHNLAASILAEREILGDVVVTGWPEPPQIDPATGEPDDVDRFAPLPGWLLVFLDEVAAR